MGIRHLLGLTELYTAGLPVLELIAVCDLRRDNAVHLADKAERLLGHRPSIYDDLACMVAAMPDLQAVDITTDVRAHHALACAALDLGLHVLCEKPLALTIRGCNRILDAQRRSGKVLSVAENYRRDPMSRLTKALLDAGAIGTPYLYLDASVGAGNRIVITPWRHQKLSGGMLLDGGVHNADMMCYYMGEVDQVYARTALWERTRFKPEGVSSTADFYAHWQGEMPASIEATAEDTLVATIDLRCGAIGQWTQSYAGHGHGYGHRAIYGSRGALRPGGTRNGVPPLLTLDDGSEVTGSALLERAPGYHLDEAAAALFGTDRPASYDMPFPEADRKLLALEYHELSECILHGSRPEVDGLAGRRAVALCYATLESGVLGRPVTLDEIEAERTGAYEAEINVHLGL